MYRAKCSCEKFNIARSSIMNSWINRKCKKCKSHVKVYSSDKSLVFDYNNATDRCKSRMNNYSLKKLNRVFPGIFNVGKSSSIPKIISLPPPPPPSPIIHDVFMGYTGEVKNLGYTVEVKNDIGEIKNDMDYNWEVKNDLNVKQPTLSFPFDFELNI